MSGVLNCKVSHIILLICAAGQLSLLSAGPEGNSLKSNLSLSSPLVGLNKLGDVLQSVGASFDRISIPGFSTHFDLSANTTGTDTASLASSLSSINGASGTHEILDAIQSPSYSVSQLSNTALKAGMAEPSSVAIAIAFGCSASALFSLRRKRSI